MREPVEGAAVQIDARAVGGDTEIDRTHLGARLVGVGPGPDQQSLRLPCPFAGGVGVHAREVAQRPAKENVVPPANVQGRHVEGVVARLDVPSPPVVVVVAVGHPVVIVSGKALAPQRWHLGQWQMSGGTFEPIERIDELGLL